MIKSLYLDTSVFGGYFDPEFTETTVKLFDRIYDEEIQILVSEILTAELSGAPDYVNELLSSIPESQKSFLDLNGETERLARTYIKEKVVGGTSLADCLHIALATINHADVLVSWNFKHLVNIERIRGYNSVNLKLGYSMVEIRSPLELLKI